MIDKYKEELIKHFKNLEDKAFYEDFSDFVTQCMDKRELGQLIGLMEVIKLSVFKTYDAEMEKN